jgi:hypothetical protein
MRRRAITTAALAGTLVAGALAAGAKAGPEDSTAGAPLVRVRLAECSRAEHAAVFVGRISRVPGARRMWMRFTLLERTGGGKYERVRAPGLGRWRKSKPGVGAFRYRQRVRGLTEGAAYRMLVRFRWYDGEPGPIRRARRRSRACRQYTARPNLRPVRLSAEQGDSWNTLRYVVRLANLGETTALDAPVALFLDGGELDRQTVPRLDPGESRRLEFAGPRCAAGDRVRAVADPDNAMQESSEDDNSLAKTCATLSH